MSSLLRRAAISRAQLTLEHSNDFGFMPFGIDTLLYFRYCRNMKCDQSSKVTRYADMFAAMGTEARLRIMQLLMTAEPNGMVVGDIQAELDIPNSTLSHHLDKLKNEELVTVRREGTYLWYRPNTETLKDLLSFLYAECCTRTRVIAPKDIVSTSR